MWEVVTVLFALMRDCVRHGDIDTSRIEAGIPAPLREQFSTWRQTADGIRDLPDGALAACMFCYSRLHGAIVLELAGHVPPQLADRDALFDLQIAHTAEALHRSSRPGGLETIPDQARSHQPKSRPRPSVIATVIWSDHTGHQRGAKLYRSPR